MWVTAYTDASLREGKCAWAIWLRCESGRLVLSGACPETIVDINHAELYAAWQAIHNAKEKWPDTSAVMINTDSLYVVNVINRNTKARGSAWNIFEDICKFDLRLRLKHCPGHQEGNGVQAYLNRQVDQLAGRHTGKFRKR